MSLVRWIMGKIFGWEYVLVECYSGEVKYSRIEWWGNVLMVKNVFGTWSIVKDGGVVGITSPKYGDPRIVLAKEDFKYEA